MDPISMALIGGNLVGGIVSAAEQRKQREQEMLMKAAEIEAQPYMKKDIQKTQVTTADQSPWQGLLKGGYGAANQIQAFQKAGLMSPSNLSETTVKGMDEQLDSLSPEEKQAAFEEAKSKMSSNPSMMWSKLIGSKA
jgi:hypothetical protein